MLIKDFNDVELQKLKLLMLYRCNKGVGDKNLLNILSSVSFYSSSFQIPNLNSTFDNKAADKVEDGIARLIKNNVGILFYKDEKYPRFLEEISDPPPFVLYKGEVLNERLESSLSVIGTRKPTHQSIQRTKDFVSEISKFQFAIISGLAFGIDKEAHLAALENGAYTVAVLASSPDVCTPVSNSHIYNKILKGGGLILSETMPWDEVGPFSFAKRNRIIAGLSKFVLFIEGTHDSGALITCNLAFDYSREVFAIPSDPSTDSGTNLLIRANKAKLVENPDQLKEDLGLKNIKYKNPSKLDELDISLFEKQILSLIGSGGSDIDTIVKLSSSRISDVTMVLLNLELRNLITQNNGKYYLN
jgi:DNA processing protein